MSFTAPEDAFLDVNDAHLRVYGNVHADGLKLGQLEVVTTTSTGSTIQFLHQHTAFTTSSNIEVGTTNHDLFVDTSTSRVGILTNTPTTALDVNGTVKATAFDGDGALLTGIPSSAINGTLSQWTTVTGPKIHYSDGQVGIGIADPLWALDVVGDINFTGTLREDGNPFVSTPWTIESSPTALSYTGGNVGIGAATPTAKLEVTGNAHVSTDLSVGGNLTINTISAAATHSLAAVTALGASTGETLQLTHATTGLVATGNVTAGTFSGSGSGLTALPAAEITGTLAVANGGTGVNGSTGTGSVVLSNAPAFSGDVAFDTNTLFVDSTNNRVGVGTTSPDVKFQVEGTSSSHQQLTKLATWNIFHHRDDGSFEHLITYSGSDGQAYFDNRDNFMYVQIPAFSGETLYTSTVSGYNSGYFNAQFRDLNGNKPNLNQNTTYQVHAYSSRISAFGTITTSGRLGIGTTSPGRKLDVRTGDIRFGDNLANYDLVEEVDDYGGVTVNNGGQIGYNISTGNSTEGWCWRFVDSSAKAPGNDYFRVNYSSGDYYHKGTAISDRRTKTNFVSIDGVDALNSITKLNPLVYNDKTSKGEIDNRLKGGFIAQEVLDVIPHLVSYDEDRDKPNVNGYATAYALDYNGVFAYNVKATQQIYKLLLIEQARNDSLEARILALENA